jgi:tripartite-type tricarboxylate transporter receptor subunit TctC
MTSLTGWQRAAIAGLVMTALLVAGRQPGAEAWPERPVHMITPASAGSAGDVVARILAEALAQRWPHRAVIVNRPGANGVIAVKAFLETPGGHALLFSTHSVVTVNPLLQETLPYDPVHDLVPISLVVEDFLAIVVPATSPVTSMAALVDHARARPGALNYYAVPGSPDLALRAFQARHGLEMTFVPYQAITGALADLASDLIQAALVPVAPTLGQAKAGRVRLLAVTNDVRTSAAPDTPTVGEAGFPDLTFGGLLGMFGQRGMPPARQQRIAKDIRDVLGEPALVERLMGLGVRPRGLGPGEFAAVIGEQRVKWAALAKAHGIRPMP